jgi:hypothetical protein
MPEQRAAQNVIDQGALAGAATRHARQRAERESAASMF